MHAHLLTDMPNTKIQFNYDIDDLYANIKFYVYFNAALMVLWIVS